MKMQFTENATFKTFNHTPHLSSVIVLNSFTESDLGPRGARRSPQHQKPKGADFNGHLSAEGSHPLGCHGYAHPEQPAGHVLAAQVSQREATEVFSCYVVSENPDMYGFYFL